MLHEVSLRVRPGSIQAVVGRNGAGKSTLVHTIAGLVRASSGRIEIGGVHVAGRQPHRIAQSGVGLVPQGRRVFSRLTVAEHLHLAAAPWRARTSGGEGWTVARTLDLLPRLAARLRHRGCELSGGEQQMLAIARALLGQPRCCCSTNRVRASPRPGGTGPRARQRSRRRRPDRAAGGAAAPARDGDRGPGGRLGVRPSGLRPADRRGPPRPGPAGGDGERRRRRRAAPTSRPGPRLWPDTP
ncbi:ATP-binding cassette domain-containing protein [Micromonospora sp. M12]